MGARLVGTLLVVISLASVARAQPAATPPPIEQAIADAAKAGKPLVVLVSTSWCGPCKAFKKRVLPDPKVQAALAAVSFVEYDAEVAPGDAAAERFHAHGYPTFLAIDAQGVARERYQGAPGVATFVTWLDSARVATDDEKTVLARVIRTPTDVKTRLDAASWYERRRRYGEAIAHYDAVVKQRGVAAADRTRATKSGERLRRIAAWRQQLVDEKVAEIRLDPAGTNLDAFSIATIESGLPVREVRKLVADVLAARTVAMELNNAIYVALAAGAYDEALFAAKRLVTLERAPNYLDTLAECHHMAGNSAEAVKLVDEAKTLSPNARVKEMLAKNRDRFASNGGESPELEPHRERVESMWASLEKIDTLPRITPANAAADAAFKAQRARWDALRTITAKTEAACRGKTGSTRYAQAMIQTDAAGAISNVVLLAEAQAPKELRTCIEEALKKHTLPPAKRRGDHEYVHLDFGPNKLP